MLIAMRSPLAASAEDAGSAAVEAAVTAAADDVADDAAKDADDAAIAADRLEPYVAAGAVRSKGATLIGQGRGAFA